MSERLHEFNTANAVDSNTQAELINNTGIENLVLDQYSNGANHFYTVNAEGKKTPISQDSILEAYGYGANPVQTEAQADATANTVDTEEPQKNPAEDTHESLQARDRASIKEHATWHRKVSTTKTKTSKNALVPEASPLIPVEDDLTPDDLAYNAWLKENATENKAKTVAQVVKDRDAEAAAAERKERLRSMAALSSRVKTGSATGQEAAYYYSLQEMSENQDQEEPTSRVNIPVRDGNGKSKDSGDTKNKFDFQSDLENNYEKDYDKALELAYATLPRDPREEGYEPNADKAFTMAKREDRARSLAAEKARQGQHERKGIKRWSGTSARVGALALAAALGFGVGYGVNEIVNDNDKDANTKPGQTTTSVLTAAELQQALGGNRTSTNGPNYVELDAERPANGSKRTSERPVANNKEQTPEQPTTEGLKDGSNPWTVSASQLKDNGYQLTTANKDAVKDEMLRVARISEAQSHNLPTDFPLPVFSDAQIKKILSEYSNTTVEKVK